MVRAFLDQLPGDQAPFTIVTSATPYARRTTPPSRVEPPADHIGLNDRVSVPDGCVGSVIGFYAGDPHTVLVLVDSGDSREYVPADLRLVA